MFLQALIGAVYNDILEEMVTKVNAAEGFGPSDSKPRPAENSFSLHSFHVLFADDVPGRHVLFHAGAEASFFASGEGGARLGDAVLKTMFVDFLQTC